MITSNLLWGKGQHGPLWLRFSLRFGLILVRVAVVRLLVECGKQKNHA